MTAYDKDLAFIHHTGFGDFAVGAAPRLVRAMRAAGIAGGTVVDLGCGSGLWLREALRAGHKVVGVDASPAMIALARTVAPDADVRVGSVYKWDIPQCEAVTALGEVFNYLPAGRAAPPLGRLFRRVAQALPPGGLFLFDMLVRGAGRPMTCRTWKTADDWAVLVDVSENVARGRLTRDITIFRKAGAGWRRSRETHVLRVPSRTEIVAELRRAGFTVRVSRRYGDLELGPRRLAFCARRQGVQE
jgi:SAM-dependent methyltransferase